MSLTESLASILAPLYEDIHATITQPTSKSSAASHNPGWERLDRDTSIEGVEVYLVTREWISAI